MLRFGDFRHTHYSFCEYGLQGRGLSPKSKGGATKIGSVSGAWVKCASYAEILMFTGIQMAAKSTKTQTFEAALTELEQVVADMESGKLTLEDSLAAYKRGAELLSFCRSRLDDAQQQVRVLEEGALKDFAASGDSN